eukprot:Awhi_evm1s15075
MMKCINFLGLLLCCLTICLNTKQATAKNIDLSDFPIGPDPCRNTPFTGERPDHTCDNNCDCDQAAGRYCGFRTSLSIN